MGSVVTPSWSATRSDFPLRARHLDDAAVWLLELSGEADIATSALLRQEVALLAVMNRDDAVVDVTRLTFCDVASAHMILTVRRSRPLTVCGATGSVKRVFDLLDALRIQRQPRYLASSRAGASRTLGARVWAA
jgi:anti-anti-sigma regulatory factor